MLKLIKEDYYKNKRSGLLCLLFLFNYRVGRSLLLKRRQGHFYLVPLYILAVVISRILSGLIGCSIPFSAKLGAGITFQHGLYGVFISSRAVIGDYCIILHQVTIGSNYGSQRLLAAPTLGQSVFVGAGAKIIGGVTLGEHSKVGVNATVVKSFPKNSIIISPSAYAMDKS